MVVVYYRGIGEDLPFSTEGLNSCIDTGQIDLTTTSRVQ
jgi:hypothetical protein